jgi:hypothetical protein
MGDPAIAARAAAACSSNTKTVRQPSRCRPNSTAWSSPTPFDLTFRSRRGMLVGWIEPNDTHQRLWDLHLFPGRGYPPDTEPEVETT